MNRANVEKLMEGINTLLQVFTVDETRYPSAEGRMRYNPVDFQTLRHIDVHPRSKGAEIARALGIAPTTQQSALDRLIRQGLVKRTDHPDSRRAKAHELTQKGRETRAAIQRQDIANIKTMLAALTPEEQTQLTTLVGRVAESLR